MMRELDLLVKSLVMKKSLMTTVTMDDVPQVVINPVERILTPEQQLVFDENVPPIGWKSQT